MGKFSKLHHQKSWKYCTVQECREFIYSIIDNIQDLKQVFRKKKLKCQFEIIIYLLYILLEWKLKKEMLLDSAGSWGLGKM